MSAARRRFAVYYRIGGRERFEWRRTIGDHPDRASAYAQRAELERAGYAAHVADAALLDAVGLPETFGPGDPITSSER